MLSIEYWLVNYEKQEIVITPYTLTRVVFIMLHIYIYRFKPLTNKSDQVWSFYGGEDYSMLH